MKSARAFTKSVVVMTIVAVMTIADAVAACAANCDESAKAVRAAKAIAAVIAKPAADGFKDALKIFASVIASHCNAGLWAVL